MTYTCARCSRTVDAKRIPFERGQRWRLRDGDHICVDCWADEPAEQQSVYRYRVSVVALPPEFWSQQRAARCLWDELCSATDRALADAQTMRARFAPAETAAAEAQRETVAAAWQAADDARRAWKTGPQPVLTDDPAEKERRRLDLLELRRRADEARTAAQRDGKRLGELYAAAKRAAKLAGCDESVIWAARDDVFREAPTWTYTETRDENDRPRVERASGGWRLQTGLAYGVVDEYRRAWSAWLAHRADGRGMPSAHGQAIGDKVRSVIRYTNGMDLARLAHGTPSLSLRPMAGRTSKRRMQLRLRMAIGGGMATGWAVCHRPLPDLPDSIRQVELSGERLGGRWVWHLNVTVRQPLATCAPEDDRADALALDLRWRVDDRYLQVAHWMDTDGDEGEVTIDLEQTWGAGSKRRELPSTWAELAAMQRAISEDVERMKAAIWMRYHGEEPVSEQFRRTGSAGLMRAIRRGEYAEMGGSVHAWAYEHGLAEERMARHRSRLIARRDQHYYEAAHALCRRTRVIVLEGDGTRQRPMNLAELAEGDDAKAGDQRQIASPYRLRMILAHVARRYGTEIVTVDQRRTSTTCPDCGGQAEQSGRLRLVCVNGHAFDQRRAACREMLARWRERRDGGETPGGARGGKGREKRAGLGRGRRATGGEAGSDTAPLAHAARSAARARS